MLTPAWPNGASSVMMANAAVRQVPHPLCGRALRRGFRRAGGRRVAAHAPAGLYLALESAGLGGHRRGAAAPARFRAAPRSLASGRRGLRPALLRRRAPRRPRPLHPADGHARRRRDGGALVFEKLLHDRLARGLAGGAAGPGGQGHPVERVHHFARAQLRPEGRRDGPGGGRRPAGRNARAAEGEPRSLPGCARAASPA